MKNHSKLEEFFAKKLKDKIKFVLSLLGLKFLLYKIFFYIFKWILSTNIFFIKGIIFDVLKYNSNLAFTETKEKEKFLIFTFDKVISKEIYVSGQFDLIKLEKTLNFLNQKKKIKNLYDIGANIGVTCISSVNRGLVEKAYAVEPEIQNFNLLEINIKLNNLQEKIKAYNFALSGADDEKVIMEISKTNSGDHRIKNKVLFNYHAEEKRKTIQVKTKKFDTLFTNINNDDLVWIDTQGHEPVILSGAEKLIAKKTPIVIEFWPYVLKRSGEWESMLNIISRFDYIIDLSKKEIIKEKTNKVTLDQLKSGWSDERNSSFNYFTDLLLLKN